VSTRARYLLHQLPGWLAVALGLVVVRPWLELGATTAVLLWLAWVLKDLLMYRFVKEAYRVDKRSELERLVGARAVVRRALNPAGSVRMRNELWQAEAAPSEALPVVEESRSSCAPRAASRWSWAACPTRPDGVARQGSSRPLQRGRGSRSKSPGSTQPAFIVSPRL
jgi:membrane protein implicated in regulation of membrane protease activity